MMYSSSVSFAFIIFSANNVSAQTLRMKTRQFINRTNLVLAKAKGAVEVGKVYTGDLVKAVHHQRHARLMFSEGRYLQAIHHSQRARVLAVMAIRANKGSVSKEMELSKEEQPLLKHYPDENTLDAEIKITKGSSDKTVIQDKERDLDE